MNFIDSLNDALSKVQDPELHRSITELGMVEDLTEVNGDVSIKVLLTISGWAKVIVFSRPPRTTFLT